MSTNSNVAPARFTDLPVDDSLVRHDAKVVVPIGSLVAFNKRLKSLNTKAAKFGLDPIVAGDPQIALYKIMREATDSGSGMHVSMLRLAPGTRPPANAELVRMAEIHLNYPIIKMGEWQVVAKLESMGEDNLVFAVSSKLEDQAAAEGHRHQAISCDHCGTQRRRNVSFLLAGADGYKEVGQSCLEDFTGIDAGKALFLAKLHDFISYNEDDEGAMLRPNCIATRDFLIRVAFLSERTGFVSVTKAREQELQPTCDEAVGIDDYLKQNATLRETFFDAYARLGELADTVRDWYKLNASTTGFDANVRMLLAGDDLLLDRKHLAFAGAAIQSYQQALSRRQRLDTDVATLRHVGEPGLRTTMRLRVDRIIPFETNFGPSWRINLRDEAGNKLSWRTGTPPSIEMVEANSTTLFEGQFRVKGHDNYMGVPQTEISHLKVLSWINAYEITLDPPQMQICP